MIKNIIFDFDGTIVDSKNLTMNLYNEIAEKNKFKPITEHDLEHLSRLSYIDKAKYLGIPFYKIQVLMAGVLKRYKSHLNNLELIEGMEEVLYKLKERNIKLSVISSNSESTIREYFHKSGIKIFDDIHSAKGLFGKDVSISRYISKCKMDKTETLYIGDEVRDIQACKKCLVKIIAVTWGFDIGDVLKSHSPDFMVNTPKEILDLL
ncbi:HAD-IA family hydrolase [Pseudobacteroides cellulosolvens]|uniref:HAD-superfamily hydrolase, subfamily IA, variant 1 n=1 Tax=Pseudobacteroides cellulosolvens ATCC 35603 = DSM 2933 TaxID=398512 RepID=A0A0L6JV22_9FIRM|nr:HAD-IA family hydrolase [Pseudobacteroides cellulosolvens]KNY29262.1 HAD-superfamily hydrolase, subfamily IA, variant 1 [Pseudobacteroides cellulosolvens ATCC 35603 = DSM 2933]